MQVRILHLLDSSSGFAWRFYELKRQLEVFSSDKGIENHICAIDDITRNRLQDLLLRRVYSLDRRIGLNLFSAYRLAMLVKDLSPDILVCWSYDLLSTVRLAFSSLRGLPVVCVIATQQLRGANYILQLEQLCRLTHVKVGCTSSSIAETIKGYLPQLDVLLIRLPAEWKSRFSRRALREVLGLDESYRLIFIPGIIPARMAIMGLLSSGIVQQIVKDLRVIITDDSDPRLLRKISELRSNTLLEDIVSIKRWQDSLKILAASDLVFLVANRPLDTIIVSFAAAFDIAIAVSSYTQLDDIFLDSNSCIRVGKFDTRAFSSCIFKVLSEIKPSCGLSPDLRKRFPERTNLTSYRADLLELYRVSY